MAVTNQKWDGSAGRWADAASYAKSCLINLNTGNPDTWTKDKCKLPIYEPNGDLNTNAIGTAAAVLNGGMGGIDAPPAAKKAAAKALMSAYMKAKMTPPVSLMSMAK
jgi:hypothetical protein